MCFMVHELFSLREQPHHLPTVADWIYREWWAGTDTQIEAIERWLSTHLHESGFPTTIVVVSGGRLAGSVSLHETEAEDRPAYRPYLAALFVEPKSRGRGFGVALVHAAEACASQLGQSAVYLNAAVPVTPFYERLGWKVVERGYGLKRLNIMQRRL
jgi:GNAT superfamily N-acetyltransferase